MRNVMRLCLFVLTLCAFANTASATVSVQVDLSSQRMKVTSDSGETYSWRISSARSGFVTPRGSYQPTSLQTMHYSKKYHHSPMPHSIFFDGGYAIHGTYAVGSLGRPASHGCIRIAPANATKLFSMVRAEGALISISGVPPASRRYAHAHHHHNVDPALAYAPGRRFVPIVPEWQRDPTSNF
jgi:hypothetical protein